MEIWIPITTIYQSDLYLKDHSQQQHSQITKNSITYSNQFKEECSIETIENPDFHLTIDKLSKIRSGHWDESPKIIQDEEKKEIAQILKIKDNIFKNVTSQKEIELSKLKALEFDIQLEIQNHIQNSINNKKFAISAKTSVIRSYLREKYGTDLVKTNQTPKKKNKAPLKDPQKSLPTRSKTLPKDDNETT
jgi:hypothetical protein